MDDIICQYQYGMMDQPVPLPIERAPMLRVFGELAPAVAALIRHRQSLAVRLALAPPEAVHSIGAFLHLAPEAMGDAADVAALIEDGDPRDLLKLALGPDLPPRLYRSLRWIGNVVREASYYQRVAAIVTGSFGDALLQGPLTDRRIAFYEKVATLDPAVAALHEVLAGDAEAAERLHCVVTFLRALGAFSDGDLTIPPGAGMTAVIERLNRIIDAVRAPDPGFVAPAGWRVVETPADLNAIGVEFGNCLRRTTYHAAEYAFRLVEGTHVFVVNDALSVMADLRRATRDVWVVDDIGQPEHAETGQDVRDRLIADFQAEGILVLPAEAHWALLRLNDREERGARRQVVRDAA